MTNKKSANQGESRGVNALYDASLAYRDRLIADAERLLSETPYERKHREQQVRSQADLILKQRHEAAEKHRTRFLEGSDNPNYGKAQCQNR